MKFFSFKAKPELTSVSPNWLAWPTLAPGSGLIKTAGVYYYQQDLNKVGSSVGPRAMAELRIQAKGKFAGAIGVFISGKILGHIPHDLVHDFHPVVETLAQEGLPATCRAELEWGGSFDVWLDASPCKIQSDDPFLPYGAGVRVVLYHGEAERLDNEIHSQAKSKRVLKTGTIEPIDNGWQVSIEGTPIGALEVGPSELSRDKTAIPIFSKVSEAGFPLTCRVRIVREPQKDLRVIADVSLI